MAKVRLLTYRNEYTFNGVEYAPVMYKVIMRLATIDSIVITQTLRDNLQNLMVFAATDSRDVNKINTEIDSNYSQILAQGATVDNPLNILFNTYLVVLCYHFKSYMKQKHNNYLDGTLTITHEALMRALPSFTSITSKTWVNGEPNLLTTKRLWPWRPRLMPSWANSSSTPSSAPL